MSEGVYGDRALLSGLISIPREELDELIKNEKRNGGASSWEAAKELYFALILRPEVVHGHGAIASGVSA